MGGKRGPGNVGTGQPVREEGFSGNNGAGGAPDRLKRWTRTNIRQGAEMAPPPKRESWDGSTSWDVGTCRVLECLYGSTFAPAPPPSLADRLP
jgi:hypothetical protein